MSTDDSFIQAPRYNLMSSRTSVREALSVVTGLCVLQTPKISNVPAGVNDQGRTKCKSETQVNRRIRTIRDERPPSLCRHRRGRISPERLKHEATTTHTTDSGFVREKTEGAESGIRGHAIDVAPASSLQPRCVALREMTRNATVTVGLGWLGSMGCPPRRFSYRKGDRTRQYKVPEEVPLKHAPADTTIRGYPQIKFRTSTPKLRAARRPRSQRFLLSHHPGRSSCSEIAELDETRKTGRTARNSELRGAKEIWAAVFRRSAAPSLGPARLRSGEGSLSVPKPLRNGAAGPRENYQYLLHRIDFRRRADRELETKQSANTGRLTLAAHTSTDILSRLCTAPARGMLLRRGHQGYTIIGLLHRCRASCEISMKPLFPLPGERP
ncbi:hypothetical protein BKA93DRAFT_751081 [Sparassis latifolia]